MANKSKNTKILNLKANNIKIRHFGTILLASLLMLSIYTTAAAHEQNGTGVLIIAHGSSSETWCDPIRDVADNVNLAYPVEVGFLERVPGENISDAVNDLESAGVTKIIAIPMFISSSSGHISEIEYILGLNDTSPEEDLTQINTTAEIILTNAIDDGFIPSQILADSANNLCTGHDTKTIVLAMHGTSDDGQFSEMNKTAFNLANNVESLLKHSKGQNVSTVMPGFINLNKNLYPDLELENVTENYAGSCEVIVIPVFISEGYYTNTKIPKILNKTDYIYPETGYRALTCNPELSDWIEIMVAKEQNIPDINIRQGTEIIQISLANVTEHHPLCPCVISAYRSSHIASIQENIRDQYLRAEDLKIISANPSDGHEFTFEYILNSSSDYIIDMPENSNSTYIGPDNYEYTFIRKSTGALVRVKVKEELFPENFFVLRTECKLKTSSAEEKKSFRLFKEIIGEKLLYLPHEEAFSSEKDKIPAQQVPEFPGMTLPAVSVIALAFLVRRKQ